MFSAFLSSLLGCKVAQLCINCFGVVLLDVFYLWGSVAISDGTEEFLECSFMCVYCDCMVETDSVLLVYGVFVTRA